MKIVEFSKMMENHGKPIENLFNKSIVHCEYEENHSFFGLGYFDCDFRRLASTPKKSYIIR